MARTPEVIGCPIPARGGGQQAQGDSKHRGTASRGGQQAQGDSKQRGTASTGGQQAEGDSKQRGTAGRRRLKAMTMSMSTLDSVSSTV